LITEIGASWELRNYVRYVLSSLFSGNGLLIMPAYQEDEGGFDLKEVWLKLIIAFSWAVSWLR
jgi:hypothetical protein